MATTNNKLGVKTVYLKGYSEKLDFNKNDRLAKVLKIADKQIPKKVKRMLDVGCGDGSFTTALAESVGTNEIHGIDIAPVAVKKAIEKGVIAQTIDTDSGKLPYPDNYFDFVYCGNLIELVMNADSLLKEISRVTAKNAYIIFTFPNLCAWGSRIASLFGFPPFYYRVSTQYDLGKMFSPTTKGESTGFIRLFTTNIFKELTRLYVNTQYWE